jgi:hypothetical protein
MSDDSISQMQMLFVPEEDRVLFRVNSADGKQFRLWLTRRYIQLMLQALHLHMESDPDVSAQASPDARQAVQSFKQEKAMQGANFEQAFKEEAEQLPLGDSAVLAYRLNYRIEKELLHLGIEPKQGQGINLAINRDINASITRLIEAAAQQADWRLAPTQSQPGAATPILN